MRNIFSRHNKVRKALSLLIISGSMTVMTGCGDYLEIIPENNIAQDNFWESKADVTSMLDGGYYFLRSNVQDKLLPWGEQRAGVIYAKGTNSHFGSTSLQKYELKATDPIANWEPMYKIINQANQVLKNASKAQSSDGTYTQEELNSHYCEAYFLRALAYFYIVRNWGEAPIVTQPYDTDELNMQVPKSSEAELIALIKSDLNEAIRLNAAKDVWDTTWETKGKATKWSIYALMADVCLWNQDFAEAITYSDKILEDNSGKAPKLITAPQTHDAWFSIFNPGNSSESIFELQYSINKADGSTKQENNLVDLFNNSDGRYHVSQTAISQFNDDYQNQRVGTLTARAEPSIACRTMYGSLSNFGADPVIWKYVGSSSTISTARVSSEYDPNFIIYRVADVVLIKAEALIMLSQNNSGNTDENRKKAIALLNQIRQRSNCEVLNDEVAFADAMDILVNERVMELLAEGKIWYDFLRISRYPDSDGFKARDYAINRIINYSANNGNAKEKTIKGVLSTPDAWFLPIYAKEISVNGALVQNKYYN